MLQGFLDWVYPPACITCRALLPLNEKRRFICAPCEKLFEPAPAPVFPKQYGKEFFFEKISAAFVYDELLRGLLNEMKFGNKKRVAKGLGVLWANFLVDTRVNDTGVNDTSVNESHTLVPMPMHPKKQRERGFNQAEILAREISKKIFLPVSQILIRTVDTPPQSETHFSQRAENVADIFAVPDGTDVRGKSYILIDDIFTTGASLNECAKTLKNAGAAHVSCMTLAVSVKNISNTLSSIPKTADKVIRRNKN